MNQEAHQPPETVNIGVLEPAEFERWDTFVDQCSEATFFHRAGWKRVIERAFGHKTYFMFAEINGEIQAVVPLVHVKSILFGNALISNAFCVYGGVAASNESARSALIHASVEKAESLGVDYLEMRNRQMTCSDWPRKELHVTFRKEIDSDPDENLKAIPRKQRAVVRKGIKAGLVGEIDADIDRFFSMYSESVRNLGTPVFPKKYFKVLREEFGEACEILTITHEGTAVSSVMSFYFRDEVLPYYGGGTQFARNVKGNDFMYWELMRRSAERGIRWFDYGRSKEGTGSYSFKKNWGFEPEPLHYEFHLVRAKELPDINPLNPKYQMFIKAWQKLPLGISQFVGPFIARNLG